MHLYFIRHGESTSNYEELITGQQDVPLTELGREQARQAGRDILAQGIKIDHIISSPLERAINTARLIAHEIGYVEAQIQLNELVMERSFGSLEGQPKGDILTMGDDYILERGGEADEQIRRRAELFIESLNGFQGTLLVVSHTGFGRRLRAVIENIPTQQSNNFNNAECTDLGEI